MADLESMLAQHKTEKKELLAECQKLKRAVPKGDKKRKKEVLEQVACMEAALDLKHQQELGSFSSAQDQKAENTSEELSRLTFNADGEEKADERAGNDEEANQFQQSQKSTRAQKRREKKSAKVQEREAKIKEAAILNLQGPRHQEIIKLRALLAQRGLKVFQIHSDGNCLYNAVKHQLGMKGLVESNESLRQKTAQLLLAKQEDYLPFLSQETGDPYTPEKFVEYCHELATTSAWGGHLELRALSEALSIPIEVVQAEGPKVTVGDQFSDSPLVLVYYRHALGLGEHYNSVVERKEDEEDVEEEDDNESNRSP